MRIREICLSLTCCGLLAATAIAQTPEIQEKIQKQLATARLDATIADALKYNPSILAAQAKVREAEIALNSVRNSVMVEVAGQYGVVEKAREVFASTEKLYLAKQKQYRANGSFSILEMMQAEIEFHRAAATLAQLEADLMKLVGRAPGVPAPGTGANTTKSNASTPAPHDANSMAKNLADYLNSANDATRMPDLNSAMLKYWIATSAAPAGMIDKLKRVLEQPVRIEKEFKNVPVGEVLEYLREHGLQGIPMRIAPGNHLMTPIDMITGELPLSAWLQMVQDSVPELRLVVREYGLLVTTVDRVPTDGLMLHDLLRRMPAAESKPKEQPKEKTAETQPSKPK